MFKLWKWSPETLQFYTIISIDEGKVNIIQYNENLSNFHTRKESSNVIPVYIELQRVISFEWDIWEWWKGTFKIPTVRITWYPQNEFPLDSLGWVNIWSFLVSSNRLFQMYIFQHLKHFTCVEKNRTFLESSSSF